MNFLKELFFSLTPKVLIYILLMGIAVVLSFSRNMIFGFYLDPSKLGAYVMVMTLASYGVMLQLGLNSGLNRELPFLLGKGDSEKGGKLVGGVTLTSIICLSIGIIIYFIIISLVPFEDNLKKTTFYLAGLVVIPSHLIAIAMLRLRAEQRQVSFALLHFLTVFFSILFGTIAIYFFSFIIAIYALCIVNLIGFIFVTFKILPNVKYSILGKEDLLYLLKIGFPLLISGLIVSFIMSVDKLFLIRFATLSDLGVYQIGLLPAILGISLNSIASQFIYPKLLFDYGGGASLQQIFRSSLTFSLRLLFLMILLSPLILFLLKFIIEIFLPAYSGSISLLNIFCLSGIFLAINLGDIVCEILKNTKILVYQNIGILTLAIFSYWSIYSGPLVHYAYVFLMLSFVKFVSSYLIAYLLIRNNNKVVLI